MQRSQAFLSLQKMGGSLYLPAYCILFLGIVSPVSSPSHTHTTDDRLLLPPPFSLRRRGMAPRPPPPLPREPLVPPRRTSRLGRDGLQELPGAQIDRAAETVRGPPEDR